MTRTIRRKTRTIPSINNSRTLSRRKSSRLSNLEARSQLQTNTVNLHLIKHIRKGGILRSLRKNCRGVNSRRTRRCTSTNRDSQSTRILKSKASNVTHARSSRKLTARRIARSIVPTGPTIHASAVTTAHSITSPIKIRHPREGVEVAQAMWEHLGGPVGQVSVILALGPPGPPYYFHITFASCPHGSTPPFSGRRGLWPCALITGLWKPGTSRCSR